MSKAHNCDPKTTGCATDALARIEDALAANPDPRPVWTWAPQREGAIDIHIRRDGTWHYLGTPIARQRLVKLFASVLRRDDDGIYYLVTPAEKLAIRVDDAPFLAVHMDAGGEGRDQVLGFRTNMDDYVRADALHPLRFAREAGGDGVKPYVTVRNGLEALATRALSFDLLDLCAAEDRDGDAWLGIWSTGSFFPVARGGEIA